MVKKHAFTIKRYVRFSDLLVICIVMSLSFTPLLLYRFNHIQSHTDRVVASIIIDGEVVDQFILSDKTLKVEKRYDLTNGKYNIIEIDGMKIRVKEDNSRDQIAVKKGFISRPGEVSICLPHKFMIELNGEKNVEQATDINAY